MKENIFDREALFQEVFSSLESPDESENDVFKRKKAEKNKEIIILLLEHGSHFLKMFILLLCYFEKKKCISCVCLQ